MALIAESVVFLSSSVIFVGLLLSCLISMIRKGGKYFILIAAGALMVMSLQGSSISLIDLCELLHPLVGTCSIDFLGEFPSGIN